MLWTMDHWGDSFLCQLFTLWHLDWWVLLMECNLFQRLCHFIPRWSCLQTLVNRSGHCITGLSLIWMCTLSLLIVCSLTVGERMGVKTELIWERRSRQDSRNLLDRQRLWHGLWFCFDFLTRFRCTIERLSLLVLNLVHRVFEWVWWAEVYKCPALDAMTNIEVHSWCAETIEFVCLQILGCNSYEKITRHFLSSPSCVK